jgi:hypothetical protein
MATEIGEHTPICDSPQNFLFRGQDLEDQRGYVMSGDKKAIIVIR